MVKEIIHVVLRDHLSEKQYSCDEAKNWTKDISEIIQNELKSKHMGECICPGVETLSFAVFGKRTASSSNEGYRMMLTESHIHEIFFPPSILELQLERYKYVIQVVIGEQRGEGVR